MDAVEDLGTTRLQDALDYSVAWGGEQLWLQGKWFPCSVCWPGDIIHTLSTFKDER
jgi:hypothetical protein